MKILKVVLLTAAVTLSACGGGEGEPNVVQRAQTIVRAQSELAAVIRDAPRGPDRDALVAAFNAAAADLRAIGIAPQCGNPARGTAVDQYRLCVAAWDLASSDWVDPG